MIERGGYKIEKGVVFAIWDGTKIQLEKRIKTGEFQGLIIIPGGSIENEEKEEKALFREVKEEYGVEVTGFQKLGLFPSLGDNETLSVRHLYLVTGWDGILSNPENKSDHLEASITEALDLCKHPLSQAFLNVIQKAIIEAEQKGD